jgi:aminoglycoside N3'-acetyltransferase
MHSGDSVSRKKIKLVQLADILVNDMHIKRNDCILVHASMSNINLVDATYGDLIFLLKMLVGVDGVLLMPVHSDDSQRNTSGNNSGNSVTNDPLNELFSKMPDTVRLKNQSGSYSMWGKLTKDTAGENVKIGEEPGRIILLKKREEKNVKIICIGDSVAAYPYLHDPVVIEKHGIAFFLS